MESHVRQEAWKFLRNGSRSLKIGLRLFDFGDIVHTESYRMVESAVKKYLDSQSPLSILDVGSLDVNGTYKSIFSSVPSWKYTGIDISAGKNVDVVVDKNYEWSMIPDEAYDVVVCGQVMEHVEEPWSLAKVIGRVCKSGGIVFVVAPNLWGYHPYPKDCWRVFPDGLRHIMKKCGGFGELECGMAGRDTFFFGRRDLRGVG